jgi:ATP-dependent Clp protease ATP-binding subunit ClpC
VPENEATQTLTTGAKRLADEAVNQQTQAKHPHLGANHWLMALMARHGAMAEGMARGLEAMATQKSLRERLQSGDVGKPLDLETVAGRATERAKGRGKLQATERDVAAIILAESGYEVIEGGTTAASSTPSTASTPAAVTPSAAGYQPRAKRPTPMLEQFGRDVTRDAAEGRLPPLVGRQDEVELVTETLCRRTKRNPVLVGPAGVGKTAIVEGLAARIVRGEVPEALKGIRVLAVQPSTLVAGASLFGEVEKRIKGILGEASQDGIALFIDEVHSIIGSGGREGTGDFASLLKPALARGDLACIAATTDEEYRRFIEQDAALERRFQPIRVQELTPEQTLEVLSSLRDELAQLQGVRVADPVLGRLVEFAAEFLRNRYFPDKAVDLLEQCVAHAVTLGKKEVSVADAEAVVQRLVGMPLALGDRLDTLREQLSERALLTERELNALINRLRVTLRGLDLRPSRPNALLLLMGEAARSGETLGEIIAGTLFGARERMVTLDFSRFTEAHDLSMLIGAPPGYVGYSDSLPLDRVAQMPWCVLRCENVDACHPQIRDVLAQALNVGFLTDARGKKVYLSDTITLLTAGMDVRAGRHIGFTPSEEASAEDLGRSAEEGLGRDLVDQCDLICAGVPASEKVRRQWLRNHLLADLSERYRKQGVDLQWDESIVQWMLGQEEAREGGRNWERLVDEWLSPMLIQYLPSLDAGERRSVRVRWERNAVQVEPLEPAAPSAEKDGRGE